MKELFNPGHNCWKVVNARRASFLIDGDAYFSAAHQAMQNARQSIIIVGWDLHSELQLIRDDEHSEYPHTLGKFLNYLVSKRKELNVYLLSWDFAMIYAMEREFFPRYKLKWRTHRQIHFSLDGEHPVGASQHQKIVVVDDMVAFSGGFDISKWRWDTPEHLPADKKRVDPDGKEYPPFHDVQMVVDGAAASALGELVRLRWQRACGELPVKTDKEKVEDPWPAGVSPDFEDIPVAIARTFPPHNEDDEIREVERLYLDSIAAARRLIYIENQYLSSHRIGEALKARLQEKDGPEIVIVLPLETGGWLEQHTMDLLRNRLMHNLREADQQNRLRIYYPRLTADPEIALMVHAKVMVIDNSFVRIGSSNLSNRSLGLDSECDLAISGERHSSASRTIASFRNRLLAEHLGVSEEKVRQVAATCSSLIEVVESVRDGERSLVPLKESAKGNDTFEVIAESDLLDPEKPIEPEEFIDHFVRPEDLHSSTHQFLKIMAIVTFVLGCAALWRWTPVGNLLDLESFTRIGEWIKAHPLAPLMVLSGYVLLGLVSFPITLIIMATVIVFGPWLGSGYALLGTVLSAVTTFLVGHALGKNIVSKISGSLINRINRRLSDAGLVAVISFRIIPVAPFTVINLVAGISSISLKDFFAGTLIGILPGIIVLAVVSDRISESFHRPDTTSFILLFAVIILAGALLFGIRRWVQR